MRKICVVTGTRAEYGLLYWLMKEIQADTDLQLQLIVTGMHLSPEFGETVNGVTFVAVTSTASALMTSQLEPGVLPEGSALTPHA